MKNAFHCVHNSKYSVSPLSFAFGGYFRIWNSILFDSVKTNLPIICSLQSCLYWSQAVHYYRPFYCTGSVQCYDGWRSLTVKWSLGLEYTD